jgi:hypothetical protein
VYRFFLDLIALAELGFWGICFWWMHRISSKQNAMLEQLKKQGDRIEGVSREEHKILRELHPTVQKIEKDLGDAIEDNSKSSRN